jgi:hypothetical protein
MVTRPGAAERAKDAALIALSILTLPVTTYIAVLAYLVGWVFKPSAPRPGPRRTVLVTGVGMTKGLVLARAFHLAGHRVIGADFEPGGALSMGRVSKAVSKFYRLQLPTPKNATSYVQGLLKVIVTEQVDLWVSCSGVASAVEDGQAKEIIEERTSCKAVQFDIATTETLHEKHSFIQHTAACGLTVPETYTIASRADAAHILRNAPAGRKYIMKPIGVVDAARADMTLLPKAGHDQTLNHLQRLPISEDCPWILQQFIKGAEFCTHSLVINGQVAVFLACPSAELLMHYEMLAPDAPLTRAMYAFTQRMAEKGGKGFTGHLSFDFMVEEHDVLSRTPTLYPIECNPRAHTAVVLFTGTHRMVDAYMSLLEGQPIIEVVTPAQTGGYKYYWVGHDLVTRLMLPTFEILTLHISLRKALNQYFEFVKHALLWRDGTFEIWDPFPWWWLYHVYWPMRFYHCMQTGTNWSRINVSTTKMFEC